MPLLTTMFDAHCAAGFKRDCTDCKGPRIDRSDSSLYNDGTSSEASSAKTTASSTGTAKSSTGPSMNDLLKASSKRNPTKAKPAKQPDSLLETVFKVATGIGTGPKKHPGCR